MSPVTQQLIDDHAHMLRVLACIDHCARRYFSDDREEQDLEMLQLGLEYMDRYADRFHHPLEEQIMDKVELSSAMPANSLQTLRQQHHDITAMTGELRKLFDAVANDQIVPYEQLNARLDDYIKLQYDHLKYENENFLPIIDENLSEPQLNQLEETIQQADDPMFGEHRQDFEELYQYLLNYEQADR